MGNALDIPADLATIVDSVVAELGLDVTDAAAMRGECQRYSDALTLAIEAHAETLSEDDLWDVHYGACEARSVQLFDCPAVIEGNPMAHGHYVCRVAWCGETHWIDITAAQFPELGLRGPVTRGHHGW